MTSPRFRFAERLLRFRAAPPARKTALVAAVLLPAHGWLWLEARELHAQFGAPATALLGHLSSAWLAAVGITLLLGAALAWRGVRASWLPYVAAGAYGSVVATTILALGVGQPLLLTWVPLVALMFAVAFDEHVGAACLALMIVLLVGAEVAGLAPFPPAPSAAAEQAIGDFAADYARGLLFVDFALLLMFLELHLLLEQRLATANRELERSQRLIRRYVPAQLADRILAGGHDEAARHERRKLTIFFSDVAGFTNLSDELDAEELAHVLNEYLAEMTAIADRFGATVNQLVGDGIMIFFGAPTATDDRDHALRAVRMAQAMQERMAELRAAWFRRGVQRPFHIRIGINTGFASVGDFGSPGRMMYSAIGQQTNLAARIQAQCEPDQILVSHGTWALVHDAIPCTAKGEIQVKGLHYPVLVYEVAGAAESAVAPPGPGDPVAQSIA